ncbi:hypothetical protein [Natrinema pallidum]|uniref:Uncharacterized protein n=1 Tax=Natrinema pallidum TaxID=69527 RepID=A0A4V1IET7_9EURY|nr:hypothetical protein [Natrinema pallidum]QCW02634.1 hypothetical protein FGF80_05020 [Natrinema pallidum]
MKRIFTALLTVALVGSMMVAGVAGTATAGQNENTDADAIDSITFYNDDGDLEQFAKATWTGDEFVIEKLDGNDDVSLIPTEYTDDGPVEVEWTYEGYVGSDHPDLVRVTAGGETCDYAVDSSTYPFTGTATACDFADDDGDSEDGDGEDGEDDNADDGEETDGDDEYEVPDDETIDEAVDGIVDSTTDSETQTSSAIADLVGLLLG